MRLPLVATVISMRNDGEAAAVRAIAILARIQLSVVFIDVDLLVVFRRR